MCNIRRAGIKRGLTSSSSPSISLPPPALHDTHLIRLLADNGPNDPAGPPHTHTREVLDMYPENFSRLAESSSSVSVGRRSSTSNNAAWLRLSLAWARKETSRIRKSFSMPSDFSASIQRTRDELYYYDDDMDTKVIFFSIFPNSRLTCSC